ncbi:uncharacterized protein LOC124117988 [Haliotis rufescens]|uniref:uncharacterized protein LOC124117988 n=1 Tax=Haliotis rufescens TaxID=6454 RepID=UPI00201F4E11|nr:uncharacterized protein LOC124117988 [Haliotis rufescens]
MSKRLNDKTRSDMSGQGSTGNGSGEMTAELWGEVYDLLCLKMKTDDAYAKLRAKGDNLMCDQIRSKMRKLTEPQKGTSKKTIKKIQKKKTSKPTAVVVPTAAAATTPITTITTASHSNHCNSDNRHPNEGDILFETCKKTITEEIISEDLSSRTTVSTLLFFVSVILDVMLMMMMMMMAMLMMTIPMPMMNGLCPLIDRTPDVSSAQTVLEQWWEQTPREPTYSPNAPVTIATDDLDDHEALKLATLPSMDLDTLPLLEASWSPASPEDVHVYSSGRP